MQIKVQFDATSKEMLAGMQNKKISDNLELAEVL